MIWGDDAFDGWWRRWDCRPFTRARTSDRLPQHRVYPYLQCRLTIDPPSHDWCAEVTYIPMRLDFPYPIATVDGKTRTVLA
jgi:putative transposase